MTIENWSEDSRGDQSSVYEIRVEGIVSQDRAPTFEGLSIVIDELQGQTLLAGPVPDQSALHGYILRIRDLGLTLISVKRVT